MNPSKVVLIARDQRNSEIDGQRTTEVVARQLCDERRVEVWPRLTAIWPLCDTYEARASRELRIFHLVPG